MDFVKLLFETHVQMTLNSPLTYHKFTMIKLNLDNIPKTIVDDCFNKYKTTPEGSLYGSVDIDPVFWTNIFFASYNLAKQNNKTNFNVPNGCCTTNNCGIKKYYELLYEYCCDLVNNDVPSNVMDKEVSV